MAPSVQDLVQEGLQQPRFNMSSSNRRFSINDIQLPTNLMKGLSIQVLKELNRQDEATFHEYFEGLGLEDVSKVVDCAEVTAVS